MIAIDILMGGFCMIAIVGISIARFIKEGFSYDVLLHIILAVNCLIYITRFAILGAAE